MTTLPTPPLPPVPPALSAPAGQRLLVDNVPWEAYVAFADALPDHPGLRMTYDRGRLELMTLSPEHERLNSLLRRLLETMAEEADMPMSGYGSMTTRREDQERGLEPDSCYYCANLARMRGVLRLDLRVHPPPDLAVEIEVSRGALDRLDIYAALGVPEVWRFDGTTLHFHRLGPGPQYAEVDRSPLFPAVTAPDLVRFVQQGAAADETSMVRAFRAWLRQQGPPAAQP
jgi:Uma2 family endonuclease